MAKLPNCPCCKESVTKEQPSKKYKNRTYHMECYKKIISEKYDENKGQDNYKQELYDYLCETLKMKEVPSQMMSQIDKYYKEYSLSYPEIKDCIYYYTNIMGKTLDVKYGIAIVPHIMNDVKQLYEDVRLATELNEDLDVTKAIKKVKIKIKQPDYSYRKDINMEEL